MFYNDETGKVETSNIKARGTLKTDVKPVNVTDLKNVSAKIHLAILSIHQLITQKNIHQCGKSNANKHFNGTNKAWPRRCAPSFSQDNYLPVKWALYFMESQ